MESTAAVEVLEAIEASVAALSVIVRSKAPGDGSGINPMRQQADDWLDILAAAAQLQAKTAALTVR